MSNFADLFIDETKYGHKIPTSEYLEEGAYPIIDQGKQFISGYSNSEAGIYKNVPAIIFGDHTRILKYVNEPFFIGADGVKILKPKTDEHNYKYLFYALQNVSIPDTGYNRHFKWLKEAEIKTPDLQTQEYIVEVLDRVDDLVRQRESQLSKLDQLVKARFVEMFGDFPANPKGWKTGKIRDIVSEVRYGTSRPAVEGGKYTYLRMNNITYSGELDLTETKQIDIPDNELDKCSVQYGDVLFNRTNSKELVGKTCVYDREEHMILAGFIIRIRLGKSILPEFLSAFLNTDFSKNMLLGMCKTAIGQANINAQELQNIKIYIPPIENQYEFICFMRQNNTLKKVIRQSLEKLETLKKSLMQEYFG